MAQANSLTLAQSHQPRSWRRRRSSSGLLFASAAAIQVLACSTAHAQQAAPAPTSTPQGSAAPATSDVSEIVVTGSLLIKNGNQAPTPLTVLGIQQLNQAAPLSAVDALNQLPVFKGSTSPQNSGSPAGNGHNLLDLRNLGQNRTLVLLDGRRFPATTTTGVVDVDLLPEALISRVDVVTGGASAAYGSDAVAGVVNFVLNTKFTGLKMDVRAGESTYSDDFTRREDVTAGTEFAGGRGHLVFNLEDYQSDGITDPNARKWEAAHVAFIPNAAGFQPPASSIASNVNIASMAYGGLITSGPLKGTTFGPGGAPMPFAYGTNVTANYMIGGQSEQEPTVFVTPLGRDVAFAHGEYDLNANLTAYAEGQFSTAHTRYVQDYGMESGTAAFTIYNTNAYLPAATLAAMNAAHITSFTLGRLDNDFPPVTNNSTDIAYRGLVGLRGAFGEWNFDAYYQHGESRTDTVTENNPIKDNLYNAANAVVGPNGSIVCQSSLANPNNGCVPIDLFGVGSPSAAAIKYIEGYTRYVDTIDEDLVQASAHGPVFDDWAGTVTAAVGADYRREHVTQTSDPISQEVLTGKGIQGFPTAAIGTVGGYQQTNPSPLNGAIDVEEVFAETEIPLVKDQIWSRDLSLNGAVRGTNYSTSGSVVSWKVGLTDQVVPDLRLRVSHSVDIRAPNVTELFSGSTESYAVLTDPITKTSASIEQNSVGNSHLVPEVADTNTGGFVYTPSWFSGASLTMDVYQIQLNNAIQTLSGQTEVNECAAGATTLCALILRSPSGAISSIQLPYINIAQRVMSGLDLEANYHHELFGGDLTFRALGNYAAHDIWTIPGAPRRDYAGNMNQTSLGGFPHVTGTFSITYAKDAWSVFLQERYIGPGKFDKTYVEGVNINDNDIPDVFYTDLSARYSFTADEHRYQVYGTINNLFNQPPPLDPLATAGGTTYRATNFGLYDVIGRYISVGLNMTF
jgi:outer membrane receptor protein involved in Fe transport